MVNWVGLGWGINIGRTHSQEIHMLKSIKKQLRNNDAHTVGPPQPLEKNKSCMRLLSGCLGSAISSRVSPQGKHRHKMILNICGIKKHSKETTKTQKQQKLTGGLQQKAGSLKRKLGSEQNINGGTLGPWWTDADALVEAEAGVLQKTLALQICKSCYLE